MTWRGVVRSLVEAYGQPVTLTREVNTGYDPVEGKPITETFTVNATAGPPHDFLTDHIEGTLIQRGDTVIDLVGDVDMESTGATGGAAPKPGDDVLIGTKTWNVIGVGQVHAEGQVATYRLHLRR